jgi:hypothetical protein
MSSLDEWTAAACRELGLDVAEANVPLVLELAKDVAHNVMRPGAPVTAYLLGLAVGRGADPTDAAGRLVSLALAYDAGEV